MGELALAPGPFTVAKDSATVLDANGGAVAHFFHGGTKETKEQAFRDAAHCALARNAFEVMMRQQWSSVYLGAQGWAVWYAPMDQWIGGGLAFGDDPFSALIEADRWYKDNVESPQE